MGLNNKAIYFATDAFFAAMIILGGFLFIYKASTTEAPSEHIDYLSKDLLVALDTLQVMSIDHPFIQQELANGNITRNNTVLEQIAEYWAKGEIPKAQTLSSLALNQTVPLNLGLRLRLKNSTLYEQLVDNTGSVVASRRMISGVDEGKPLQGSSSYGYLRSIKDKKTSAYAYFGGFVGQGNVTVQLEPLPDDVNDSRIQRIIMQADLVKSFDVSINGIFCDNLEPSYQPMIADQWDITHCNDSLGPGNNNVTLVFNNLNDAYIGGGFIRVDYETDYFQQAKSYTETTYTFPEISGIINLYDAFHVPGELQEMEIYLHYHANHTNLSNPLYLTIGNTVVHLDDTSTDPVTITLDDAYLSARLNYSQFDKTSIPLRMGFENLSYSTEYFGNADVCLVTDRSGSMAWNFTHDWGAGIARNCNDSLIYDASSERLSVAKCLDKDFLNTILRVNGNRVGLTSYSTDVTTYPLTTNVTALEEEIGLGVGEPAGYGSDGATCICCGINEALNVLLVNVTNNILFNKTDDWYYWNASLKGHMATDGSGREWYHPSYSLESSWSEGTAVLGHDGGSGGVAVTTELGANLGSHRSRFIPGTNDEVMDLWELVADNETPELDFTSGLNSTANTYGLGAANDGWDWASGTFGFSGSFKTFAVEGGRMRLESDASDDSSGSFAVSINITQAQYDLINSNGTASLSFFYWWEDNSNSFEDDDHVWVKGRWTSPYTGSHWLGGDLDSNMTENDAEPEIATRENPNDGIFNEFFSQDLSSWIEGPGLYYLELGGKLDRSTATEFGNFYFDNILLFATNETLNLNQGLPVDLWEIKADTLTPEIEFTSGLNSTANTYGLGAANDGWDWSSGTFDHAGAMNFMGTWNGKLRMQVPGGTSEDVSGAYAVSVNITQEHYDIIAANGTAVLYLNYWWDDYRNYFEANDQMWIKGRWSSPYSGQHWIGKHLDAGHEGADLYPEIATEDNPNIEIQEGFYSQDLASWIEGPGLYYLELGGKLTRSATNEWGDFYFDNILLMVRNVTDHYYFRKHFDVSNLSAVKQGVLNLLADDNVNVYLNGELVLQDEDLHEGEYWDMRGYLIEGDKFVSGDNLIAIELTNAAESARMDAELRSIDSDRSLSMFVMTDGVANRECLEQGWTGDLDFNGYADEPGDDAIKAACDAAEQYGITMHSVGFGDEPDEPVLERIASCGNGLYYKSSDAEELKVFYQDVAIQILQAARQSQSLIVAGNASNDAFSTLFADSYIWTNHTSRFVAPLPNEIELVFQTPQFNNCTANITIPAGLRVSDARVTSYSGDHWTSLVSIDNNTIFNLSSYAQNYSALGDPFNVHIPASYVTPGQHLITMATGDNDQNTTGCSDNNSLIYTGFINSSTARSSVVEEAEGCDWTVQFEDDTFESFAVPQTYTGPKNCFYTNASHDPANYTIDAYDSAVYSLLEQLDFDKDGRVFVNLAAEDLEIIVSLVSEVPYLWGPAIMRVEVWQ